MRVVLLGPSTIVTAEKDTSGTALDYKSVAVGQHIIARGIYSLPASGVTTLDATGASSTNTGSVRIQTTELYGSLVSSASGSLVLDLQTIDNWPVSIFNFAGNGTGAVTPASYAVDTGTLALPAGAAPQRSAVGRRPRGAIRVCAAGFQCDRDQCRGVRSGPLAGRLDQRRHDHAVLCLDADRAHDRSHQPEFERRSDPGRIRKHRCQSCRESRPRWSRSRHRPPTAGLPPTFLPAFAIGNLTAAGAVGVTEFNSFAKFVVQLPKSIVAATPAYHFVATGVYNRSSNTFTASSIDVVN